MQIQRLLASLVNWVLSIVNIILWIFGINPLGCTMFNTWCPDTRGKQFIFGLVTIIVFGSMIGFLINAFFWFKDDDSIPVRIMKAIS